MVTRSLILLFFLSACLFAQSVEECMDCHSDEDLSKSIDDSTEISLFIDLEKYENSIHGGFECIDCHSSIKDVEHEPDLPAVNCTDCHEDVLEEYAESIHAHTYSGTKITIAGCHDCHGSHYILPSDEELSLTNHRNIDKICSNCHTKPEVLELIGIRGEGPVALYHNSIHDRKLHEDPALAAPTCSDCHGYHSIYYMSDPRSSFNKLNISGTCGNCHKQEKEAYDKSIHWRAVSRGHFESPTCNNCHGEHRIESPQEKDALTNRLNSSSQICAKCHSSASMMQRFGLDSERFTSYMRTYHGLAVLKGSPDAANCTSCHEVHAIIEQTNPKSSVYPANLNATCGKCHTNIGVEFVSISVHPKDMEARNPIAFYARSIYIWLLILIIGGMVLHNIIIFRYYIVRRRALKQQQLTYQRFMPFEVYQHILLIISFLTLVVTGFALKYPEAFWVQGLVSLGMTETIRSNLHRIAAVILVAVSLIQAGYFIFHKKGRKEIYLLRPQISDLTGFWSNMKYHLGFSKEKPKFGRWDYTEKAEYLALIWGTAVMALTGFVLWFPELFMRFLPSWMFEVSEVIHLFEAWLAMLAIFVWHWFFVIFHPERYPMSLTWLDGQITEEEMKHHHPLEYEELKQERSSGMGK